MDVRDYDDHSTQAPAIFNYLMFVPCLPLLDPLHSELEQQVINCLEDLVRPLRDEILATRCVAARVATHLKHVELPSKDPFVDVSSSLAPVHLFGAL